MNADWCIRNNQINKQTGILIVSEEIRNRSRRYQTRLENHPNLLAITLLNNSEGRASEDMVSWAYLTDTVNKYDEIGSTLLFL
jgi:hypothetical protein